MGDLIEVIRTITIQINDRHVDGGKIHPEITIIDETQTPSEDPDNRVIRFLPNGERLMVIDNIHIGINRAIKRSDGEQIKP